MSSKISVIADPALRHGCKVTWGLGNQLYLYAGSGAPHTEQPIPGEAYIHRVNWEVEMHVPVARKLVNESLDIFLKLQRFAITEAGATDAKSQLVKISREYRSVIKACVVDFQQYLKSDAGQGGQGEAQLELFELIELVWNLCEILFIDSQAGGTVLAQLLEWLRWHFMEGNQHARQAASHEYPHRHPQYWPAIYSFVLQGRLEDARHLLSLHPAVSTDPFTSIDELLAKMPNLANAGAGVVSEFDARWRHWQEECMNRLNAGEFASVQELNTIARILCGEDDVFRELRDVCETWYCMLLSRLLYQHPTVKALDLHYHAQFCIDAYGGNSELQPWDSIILAALEYDIHQVIKESSAVWGNWWFVAHLTDLLHHAGKLDSQKIYGSSLREFLLLEYASSLMSHPSLWQVAVNYFDNCPELGMSYLEHYIERIPLDSDKKARKVINICEKRELIDQVRSICKIMGLRALHDGHLGSAMSWCLRSKDVGFVTYLAERFLVAYSETGDFSNLDLIDNLGPSMLLSSKLTFLGKYREFHRLYQDGQFLEAGSLLLSLLSAKLAPVGFWQTLLADALPLLEADEVIFDTLQTYELMHCLEEMNLAQNVQEEDKDQNKDTQMDTLEAKKSTDFEKEKLDLLRLALARNLARAIVQEGNTKL